MSNSLPFLVRRMESHDLPTVLSVDRIVFNDPWPESVYVQELYFNPHARYFVVQLDNQARLHRWWPWKSRNEVQVIGYVGMRLEGVRSHISTLAVRPNWHGIGLGELLLLTALEQAVSDQSQAVTLEVRVTNYVAQALYTKYGFVQQSRLTAYYRDGEDAFLMRVTPLDEAYQQILCERRIKIMERLQMWNADAAPGRRETDDSQS